jgi:hypothetical protein
MSAHIARTGHAQVHADAAPEAVWALVADVTRVGEWSGECLRARWLGDAHAPAVGARFRGYNRARRVIRWSRANELITVDPPREIAWRTLPSVRYPDSTEWRIRITPAGTGSTITQDYRVVKMPALLDRLFALVIPAHRDRDAGLRDDLGRLAVAAARTSPAH